MGEGPARTMREIDEIRDRIDAELDELGEALPPAETLLRKAVLAAVGGATTLLTLWFIVHRIRIRLQDRRVRRLIREAIEEANGAPGTGEEPWATQK